MEKVLYDVLTEDLGFKQKNIEVPINNWQQFKSDFMPIFLLKYFPIKTVGLFCKSWLVKQIGDNYYEALFDDYNVSLRRNGEVIFDKRRFDNKEFLDLLV